MLLSVGRVTGYRYLCASERWTDHGTDHRTLDRSQNIPQDGLQNRLRDTADKLLISVVRSARSYYCISVFS